MLYIYILLIILGILLNRKINFNLLVILFTISLVYLSIKCPDYSNYENVYNHIGKGNLYLDTGIAWYYICRFFTTFKINFRIFKTIIVLISIVLINQTVKFFSNDEKKYKSFFWIIYLIFPLLLDCIQFRFVLAASITFFSFKYWNQKKISKIVFTSLLLVIATLIHSTCHFFLFSYFFQLVSKKLSDKGIIKYFLAIIVITFVIYYRKDLLIKIASHFVNGQRIERYFNQGTAAGILSIIINFLLLFINYSIIKYQCIISKNNINYSGKDKNILETIRKINLLTFLILPLQLLDANFIRITRITWLLNLLAYIIAQRNEVKKIVLFKIKLNYANLLILLAILQNIIFFYRDII